MSAESHPRPSPAVAAVLFVCMALLTAAFTVAWWTLNIDANLNVVDKFTADTPQLWYLAAALAIGLSAGQVYWHLSLRQRLGRHRRQPAYTSAPLASLLAFLTTVADIPLPAYGLRLEYGWSPLTAVGLAFFGSVVCQFLAVECGIETLRLWSALLDAFEDAPEAPQSVASPAVVREVKKAPPPRPAATERVRAARVDAGPIPAHNKDADLGQLLLQGARTMRRERGQADDEQPKPVQ